jgi:uncharacterized protein (TIGR02996 family)
MSNEKGFLDAIRSDPGDRVAHLVYADWLEERGDPRGELVRLEEEMRETPVYSDRYWQLKPRRNTLRLQVDKQWLQDMQYGTDYEPVFRDVPVDWKGRWRLLREFIERWHGIPMPDVGGRVLEVEQTEKELGCRLPLSVREWIAFGSDLMHQQRFDQVLRDWHMVKRLDDLAAISLMLQAEGDFYWAIKEEDLAVADPPVQGYVLDWEHEAEHRFVAYGPSPFAPRLTNFVMGHMSCFLHGVGGGFGADVRAAAELTTLTRQLTKAFPSHAQFDDLSVFEATNVIVLLGPSRYGDNEPHLMVEVWKPILRQHLPAFLWECIRGGGSFHGMFDPRRST